MKIINIKLVKLTVTQTNYLVYTIIFTKVYYCPDFFINIILFSVLWRKEAFFNSLYNIINFIKDQAEIVYILCINGLNIFILVNNPVEVSFIIALVTV